MAIVARARAVCQARPLASRPFSSYEITDSENSVPAPRRPVGNAVGGVMRFLLTTEHYQEMRSRADHTPDCYVRPGQYLHHLYLDGVKYVVAPALAECLDDAVGR